MAGAAPEGTQFDARQFDAKMNDLLTADGQDFFTSYDEVYDSFDAMGLQENLLRGIYAYGFEKPSAIQQRGIVPFCKGLDVIQQAQSGTGKTATFCSGILQQLDYSLTECQALVLAPTCELAQQIEKVMRALGYYLGVKVYACVGGTSAREDQCIVASGVHVVVGTPGLVFDMLRRQSLQPDHIKMFVLDEADEMLSRGFKDQIYDIFRLLPSKIQVGVFSATMPPEVLEISISIQPPAKYKTIVRIFNAKKGARERWREEAAVQVTMRGDATDWDENVYRERLLKEREIQTRTVFRTAWAPSPLNPNPHSFVVASSDGSVASYSIPSCISNLKNNTDAYAGRLLAEPDCFFHGHDGPAYDVKFYGDGEDALLLSCGDDGFIRGWRWKELANSNSVDSTQGSNIKPILDLVNPQHKGPWGALSPVPENNAIAVNSQGGSVFSASGDSCAYCWDVETGKVKMVFKGHSDYLHCIVARNSSNQIITGSEDKTARIWDCKSGKCIKVIDPSKDLNTKGYVSWVGSVALDASESWLACSSGRNISIWNLPASECLSRISTHASVQDMIFDSNQILAVGADSLLNRFDMNGAILSQIKCAPSSAFSVSLHPVGVVAVGGYGCLVDVISQFCSHMCTFHCKCI
ncbi:hypothetical protein PIB30_036132 [Stylosanthes scabra]|uniref:RNA helicase n=1 Tax=Stylosanthes scabra TaxID=79078 RepID=A0ABU6WGS4_9FABA|nr:hypothetical protein [Stylosanthes scabra]